MVYEAFTDMVIKLKENQVELLGMLIRQIEAMQNRTSRNKERIRQIDNEIVFAKQKCKRASSPAP